MTDRENGAGISTILQYNMPVIQKECDGIYNIDYPDDTGVCIKRRTEEGTSLNKIEYRMGKWCECFFSVCHCEANNGVIQEDKDEYGNIIEIRINDESKDYSLRSYALEPDTGREYGGLELEFILKGKPSSNVVEFDIDFSDDLVFAYQPPLTEDADLLAKLAYKSDTVTETEILDVDKNVIASRPINIIYSYAIYGSKRNNKYKTGKIAHIERPKAIDSRLLETWCSLDIDTKNKKLYITIPQSFLNEASYPVVVDPTFGYTSVGFSFASAQDIIVGIIDNPGENGEVTKITAYLGLAFSGDYRKCALYTTGGTLVSPQSVENSAARGSSGWEDFTVSNATVSDQDYAVCLWADWASPTFYYDTGGPSGTSKYINQSYGSWPASVSFTSDTIYPSIYATYTQAGVTINDVDTDDDVFNGQLSTDVNGINFEASQGSGKVEFGDAATYGACTILIEQPISSWSDTQITLTKARKGSLSNGTVYAYVTTDSDEISAGHAFTIKETWGVITAGELSVAVNHARAMGGNPPNVDNMYLISASVRVGATHSSQIRIGVYQGGNLATGPDGATLLKDFGQTTGSSTNTWLTLTHAGTDISVNKTDPLWLAWKGNDSGFDILYSSSSANAGDFQTARGRYASTAVSTNEATAYPSTWPSDGGSFTNFWYSIYLTFGIRGWKSGTINGIQWYYISTVNGISIYDISTINGV